MPVPDNILQKIKQFEDNLASYKTGTYNETQTRHDFIDPLFEALGWDVNNTEGYAEAYREVVHEDAIKVEGKSKAPDYCFRIGGTRKFFVEAKKPAINIKEGIDPAFQLRRYAWSAKLPLSILTDFEEFAVYDCRIPPEKGDGPGVARVFYCTYKELPTKWDEIGGIFSKTAILKGAFDRYVEDKKNKRGTTEVDTAFLNEIEKWRTVLAGNLARRNPHLTARELNFAVQITIDRIIFLRICEDRGIEEYGRLESLLKGSGVYVRLCEQFRDADERYNSGLFHFQKEKGRSEDTHDTLTPTLKVDDAELKAILSSLYYPAPYAFDVFPADILGQVYERFLGKVIRLDEKHRAFVDEKPEVKKAGGVYYTPTYIVNYIVERTVGKALEGKTPKTAAALKILDPACGSGSFLLGAYTRLLDWHLQFYLDDGAEKHAKGKEPKLYRGGTDEWKLTTTERRRILLNNLYGVDIDPQAVEVTKLSLLLKMLEGETKESVNSQLSLSLGRVLPDLDRNIRCGNSLIGSDFYDGKQLTIFDEEEMYRVNVFDWNKAFPQILTGDNPGFGCIIGNPPYRMLQPHNTEESILNYLKRNYVATDFKIEMFHLFLQGASELVVQGGRLGYIVPTTILNNVYAQSLRSWLTQRCCLENISVAQGRVFADADVHTSVIILKRENDNVIRDKHKVETMINLGIHTATDSDSISTIRQEEFKRIPGQVWNVLLNANNVKLIARLSADFKQLNDFGIINRGLITGAKGEFFSTEKLSDKHVPIIAGGDVYRYHSPIPSQFVLFQRPDSAGGCWDKEMHFAPHKILIRQIGKKPTATMISEPNAVTGNIFTVRADSLNTERFLLGIINSSLIAYFWKIMFTDFKASFPQVTIFSLAQLPIRAINFDDKDDRTRQDALAGLVERMLDLTAKLATASPATRAVLQKQTEVTDAQIDRLVYELYGLTDAEIALVEGAN